MNKQPLLSIITVVYNSEKFIEGTIKSIIDQTFNDYEYIIIDGKSKDQTLDIIKKYDNKVNKWISEPDKGLYDAMNKGIELAKGEYILFMNSGDKLYDKNTLESIFKNSTADIYYGDTVIINESEQELGPRRLRPPKKLTSKSLKNGMLICHQSLIVKKSISPLFNIEYKYSADYDWSIKCVKNATQVINTNLIISKFMEGGQTSNTVYKGLKERFDIMKKHYGLISAIMQNLFLIPRFFGYLLTKKI